MTAMIPQPQAVFAWLFQQIPDQLSCIPQLMLMQRALLRTAQEIAKGMDYIHSFGIIHGDLKLGNVLLKTHRVDRRGYVAKVSDFGMCSALCAIYPC